MDFPERVAAARGAGASLAELAALAAELLAQPGDPGAEEGELARAHVAFAGAEAMARDGWRRYPEMRDTGAHGSLPDPRAAQLFVTFDYLRHAGFYTPEELTAMLNEGKAPRSWVAREARRLQAFLAVLPALVDGLDDGSIAPGAYGDEVERLARLVAAMRVA